MSVAANVAMGAAVLLTGLSLLLSVVGLVSWSRLRHPRLLWVSVAFALFAAQGVYLAERAYAARAEIQAAGLDGLLPTVTFLDLAIVLALYLAAWK